MQIALGLGLSGSGYKEISWIKNRNFPIKYKTNDKCKFKVVYINEFWEWAEKNRSFIDFSKMEENILGKEPDWVKQQRRVDYMATNAYKITPWTAAEDRYLLHLLRKFKYTYLDLSKKLKRTSGAIQRRICDLGYKERPIKADNKIAWTDDEIQQLIELIKQGMNYMLMAEIFNKSDKAIRGKVYREFGSEDLDKVRNALKEGEKHEA